jgi:predicted dienelactone hydrolase
MRKTETADPLIARWVGAFLVLGILSSTPIEARGATFTPHFKVGYQVLDLTYQKDAAEKTLTVAVWYPTATQPKPHNYGGPTNGNVAVGGVPRAGRGPYPLLVFSHGYGGGGLGAVFFTETLAARGWIVACPDHDDKHSAVRIRTGQEKHFDRRGLMRHAKEIAASGPGERGKYLYRLDEMSLVLDGMLTSQLFGKLIDRDRIAVGGHSFGGFTALGLSGTIKERHDSRIKAVLLFSTGAGGYLFREDELRAVRIPSMLFMGEREQDQRRGSQTMSELSAKIYRNVSSPKYFLEVKGASHFSFNNRFVDNRSARLLSGTEEQFEIIRRYSIAFLEKHVVGNKDSDHALTQSDPLLTRYVTEPVSDASKHDLEAPTVPSDSGAVATAFARQLAARSPKHDGVPLRTYVLQDLDNDAQFEVLEYVSAFEDAPGFMNVEMKGAFEWVNIYAHGEGGFRERTASHRWFLTQRKEHYLFWLRVIASPAVLSADSRGLVEANKERFRAILGDYLRRIQALQ